MMKLRMAAVTFLPMTLLAACAGGAGPSATSASTPVATRASTPEAKVEAFSQADQTELRAAIDRTLNANSVRIDRTNESAPGTPDAAVYRSWSVGEKPDRIRNVTLGELAGVESPESESEIIQIGSDAYDNFEPLTKAGNWHHQSGVETVDPFSVLESTLRSVKIDRRDGNLFTGTAPFEEIRIAEVKLELANGYVTMIQQTIVGDPSTGRQTQVVTERLSQFDSTPPITAPPKNLIEVTPPGTCAGMFCSAPSNNAEAPIEIPDPPSTDRSTVQFRPVLMANMSGECGSNSTNPSPAERITLQGDDGCFLLGPSALELTQAMSVTAGTLLFPGTPAEAITVAVQLRSEDAGAFDRMAEANFGKQVAIVMFGRVISAPTINAIEFNGGVQISGISREEASLLKASLVAK